jgi:hypothetical protein
MGTFIVILGLIGPLYVLYFGFLGGFGATLAEGGREDHSICQNALVGAIASIGFGLVVPAWRLADSAFAGPIPTLIGAALIWTVPRRMTPPATEVGHSRT